METNTQNPRLQQLLNDLTEFDLQVDAAIQEGRQTVNYLKDHIMGKDLEVMRTIESSYKKFYRFPVRIVDIDYVKRNDEMQIEIEINKCNLNSEIQTPDMSRVSFFVNDMHYFYNQEESDEVELSSLCSGKGDRIRDVSDQDRIIDKLLDLSVTLGCLHAKAGELQNRLTPIFKGAITTVERFHSVANGIEVIESPCKAVYFTKKSCFFKPLASIVDPLNITLTTEFSQTPGSFANHQVHFSLPDFLEVLRKGYTKSSWNNLLVSRCEDNNQ